MLPNWYNEYKTFISNNMFSFLDKYLDNKASTPLENFKGIISYSILGGKRIRSILALEFYMTFSGKTLEQIGEDDDIVKLCIAIEMIHSYSLIHDDLPCIDNDSYRRGELTVWKKYGESNATLVGDLLNSIAFEILSEIKSLELSQKLVKLISKSVGFHGMLGGQVEDLYFEKNPKELNRNILRKLHNKKTGTLITASVLGGIILSNKNVNLENYQNFGQNIGLGFQIKDDILDVEGTLEKTGKSVGGETKGFVHFLGLEKSKQELKKLTDESLEIIKDLKSEKLNFLVNYIKDRNK